MRVSGVLRGVLAAGLALGVLAVGSAPAHAEDQDCSSINAEVTDTVEATSPSSPAQLMQVAQAQRLAARSGSGPGQGVTVAVLDSGVAPSTRLNPIVAAPSSGRSPELLDYQGTAIAGLIAGRGEPDKPIGIAPEATIMDVRVYDRREAQDPAAETEPSLDLLIQGLRHVANLPRGRVGVVNVSLALPAREELGDALRAVLADLAAKDVVVVAATGDRPEESDALYSEFGYAERDGEDEGSPPPGEDAGGAIWPAAAPHVVAVNATATALVEDEVVVGDAADSVLRSSDTDLAAPSSGAVSLGMDGRSTCVLGEVSSEYAAAEVSGVVALLRSAFPDDTAAQVVARLTRTATGSPLTRNVLTGHGIVQPVEALTRPLRPGKKGQLPATTIDDRGDERATAPREQPDVLASTKRNAVWWGLLAGGALIVATMLRPVLARRRE
ncbi:S8/S53 family peptidase [Nocardioides sp. cx-169]|uniref:S8 family serine peptidase n=1 Tax=Nocardioides sp. cx-169 TaxID=2899080 RepID=UPI001E4C4DE9|nr:S8 family serine peptidase [Nocardioides sp. cx-169]MCD4532770.1 S8/S53 family peptidase [Nocardioides sp. cx-169]